jgi:asparagine synthase (glutamine-hydrolysing)
MCGFTGFFNYPELNNNNILDNLVSIIKNRGPDETKLLNIDEKLFLIFTRLSIVDLSDKGNQPMTSNSGKYIILFNGEFYNHKLIRDKLEANGFIFTGNSDTEVILEAIEYYGLEFLEKVEGMYSMILFNKENSFLYLINDRFGEKPLYYYYDDKTIFFSSDIKSFTFKKRKINTKALSNYFNNYVINYPHTIWDKVHRIEPSQILKFKLDFKKEKVSLIDKKKYWINNKNIKVLSKDSLQKNADKLENLLFSVIERQLDNDTKTGCFLSGGIDSTLVSVIASKLNKNLTTLSIGFSDNNLDESKYAIKISDYLKTDHYNKIFSPDDVSYIFNEIPRVYGEPFADSSQLPTMLLCKFASTKVKVALTGDGGDELFGGYDRYSFVPKFWKYLRFTPKNSRILLKKFFEKLSPHSYTLTKFFIQKILLKYKNTNFLEIKLRNLILSLDSSNPIEFAKKLSFHFFDEFGLVLKNSNSKTEYDYDSEISIMRNIMLNDINDYLPNDLLIKVDRAAMHHGLETRIPFLNHNIFEFSQSLPDYYKNKNGNSKIILKEILKRYLPESLFNRPKHGFLAPLKDVILSQQESIKKLLNQEKINQQNIIDSKLVGIELENFIKNKGINQYNLWDIIVFQQWLENNQNNIA